MNEWAVFLLSSLPLDKRRRPMGVLPWNPQCNSVGNWMESPELKRQVERSFKPQLGGGFKYVLYLPLPWEMIQFDYGSISVGLKSSASQDCYKTFLNILNGLQSLSVWIDAIKHRTIPPKKNNSPKCRVLLSWLYSKCNMMQYDSSLRMHMVYIIPIYPSIMKAPQSEKSRFHFADVKQNGRFFFSPATRYQARVRCWRKQVNQNLGTAGYQLICFIHRDTSK